MKIRNGFVSNSSSSSYIIAFDPNINLDSLFVYGNFSGDETNVNAVGVNSVMEELKDWYGIGQEHQYFDNDETYAYEQFVRFAGVTAKVASAVDNGDNVALVCISYGDDESSDNLSSVGIRVIESFG